MDKVWIALQAKYLSRGVVSDALLEVAQVVMPSEPAEEAMAEAMDKASKEIKDLRLTAPEDQVPNHSDEELEDADEEGRKDVRVLHGRSASASDRKGETLQHLRERSRNTTPAR